MIFTTFVSTIVYDTNTQKFKNSTQDVLIFVKKQIYLVILLSCYHSNHYSV